MKSSHPILCPPDTVSYDISSQEPNAGHTVASTAQPQPKKSTAGVPAADAPPVSTSRGGTRQSPRTQRNVRNLDSSASDKLSKRRKVGQDEKGA